MGKTATIFTVYVGPRDQQISMTPVGSPASEMLGDVTLCGVAFYEDEIGTRYPYGRCHGPISLCSRFLPDVEAWIKSQ
jgi:hypothetical protein